MRVYTFRHGITRHIGLSIGGRRVFEIMWIKGNRQRGLGIAVRKGGGWRTRYVFCRPSGPFQRHDAAVGAHQGGPARLQRRSDGGTDMATREETAIAESACRSINRIFFTMHDHMNASHPDANHATVSMLVLTTMTAEAMALVAKIEERGQPTDGRRARYLRLVDELAAALRDPERITAWERQVDLTLARPGDHGVGHG